MSAGIHKIPSARLLPPITHTYVHTYMGYISERTYECGWLPGYVVLLIPSSAGVNVPCEQLVMDMVVIIEASRERKRSELYDSCWPFHLFLYTALTFDNIIQIGVCSEATVNLGTMQVFT